MFVQSGTRTLCERAQHVAALMERLLLKYCKSPGTSCKILDGKVEVARQILIQVEVLKYIIQKSDNYDKHF